MYFNGYNNMAQHNPLGYEVYSGSFVVFPKFNISVSEEFSHNVLEK